VLHKESPKRYSARDSTLSERAQPLRLIKRKAA